MSIDFTLVERTIKSLPRQYYLLQTILISFCLTSICTLYKLTEKLLTTIKKPRFRSNLLTSFILKATCFFSFHIVCYRLVKLIDLMI